MNDRNPLDDAIDRTLRDMTHVAADDRAVARVMARVRGADARDARTAAGDRWMLTPRVAWCGLIAILLMALFGRSWYPLRHHPEGQRAAVNAPQSAPQPPQPAQQQQLQPATSPFVPRESPTRVAAASSTTRAAAAARIARGEALMPTSVASHANDAGDTSEQRARQEPTPLESDIVIASITPAPLAGAPPILVEPLVASSLTIDEIPVASIDVPPVSPERQK